MTIKQEKDELLLSEMNLNKLYNKSNFTPHNISNQIKLYNPYASINIYMKSNE